MSKFRTRNERGDIPESPEALFRTLRPGDSNVRHLWAHQADLLRSYIGEQRAADLALELPTGAGKTLVGLLIGEFRRRARDERVAYLCPTIHLAQQTGRHAERYGLHTVVLTGRGADYPPPDFTAFVRGEAIAVTTYSAVFNTNPRIDSADVLILDDAHSGEAPVADMWSVLADRGDGELYSALLATLADGLPRPFSQRLNQNEIEPYRRREADLVIPYVVAERADRIREILRAHATDNNAFSASMLEDHIGECLVFASWNEILLRPLIPPTFAHPPFANASQRVYMSATLGSGGELERAFGVRRIRRLPIPPGWDEHGTGRRFFLFPGAARTEHEVDVFVSDAVRLAGRALVLAPSRYELETAGNFLPNSFTQFGVEELRIGASKFARTSNAVLLLANRYDGIDLPDEACRLIVLTGLPSTTHLQERFLYERLGATRVLAERIRTRILQGAGRCTRNDKDFAAVIVRGAALLDFMARDENVAASHPETQAEVEFGYDNSETREIDLLELLRSFLGQDKDWHAADDYVRRRSRELQRAHPGGVAELQASADHEVDAWLAIWRGDHEQAIARAQQAADVLGTSAELRAYRALWLYLAASWATIVAERSKMLPSVQRAEGLAAEASACARPIAWVPLVRPLGDAPAIGADFDGRATTAATRLMRLGIRGTRAEDEFGELVNLLASDQATSFELGLEKLGPLLGFESVRKTSPAAPDCAWRDGTQLWVLCEAKTEETATDPVDVSEVRQANTHHDWVKAQLLWEEPARSITCIITYRASVDSIAESIASPSLVLCSPDVIREITDRAIASHREVRARARVLSPEQTIEEIAGAFHRSQLDSEHLIGILTESRVRTPGPPVSGGSPGGLPIR